MYLKHRKLRLAILVLAAFVVGCAQEKPEYVFSEEEPPRGQKGGPYDLSW